MRKILIIALLLCLSLSAGCGALQQPAPAPEPTPAPSVIPETSKLGFSPVDLNKAPDVIKNIASDISKREAATWAQVNGTNYILASVGENTKYKIEITDVIQKVPAQDFIWIEVKGKYVSLKEGEKNGQVTVISLNPPNKAINGAGFEITRTAAAAPTTPAPTTQTPAPTVQTPKITPAPAAPTPAPATEQGKTTTEQTKKTQPSETNSENSNSR